MLSSGSFTKLIGPFKDGDEQALEKLRQKCWPILVKLAREKLGGGRKASMEDEDVAQEVFWGFCRSFQAGKVPHLENRHHLFALLTLITLRKAANRFPRGKHAKKVCVNGESALKFLTNFGDPSVPEGLAQLIESSYGPTDKACLKDFYSHYLNALAEDDRAIAKQWLLGDSHQEIADATAWSVPTVRQKLKRILAKWRRMADDEFGSSFVTIP